MSRLVTAAILVVLAALPPWSAAAQPAVPPRPAVGPERPFAPPPRVERTLANGLQVVVARFATVPKVSVYLSFRSGLSADPAGHDGLAQFVADAAQEGTVSRTSRQLRDEVFAMGASLGATVGQDASTFVMRGLAETLPQMLGIVSDVVRRPTFPEAEVQLLLANAAQRTQAQLASASFVSNRQFRAALFGDHPYGRIGATPASVKAIDREAIVAYHRAHYLPNNAFLIVTGDVDAAAVMPAVERAFADWARGEVRRPAFPDPPVLDGRRLVFVHRPGSVQSSISVGNRTIARDDPRWYMVQMANQIYGGAFDSRLVRNIREDKGYTYSPQSQFAAFADTGVYRAVADVRNDVTGATLKEIYAEMDGLRSAAPAAAELDGAKAYARGLFVIQNATQNGLAATLNAMRTFGLPADYPETFQERMTALAPEAVVTGARMLLGSEDSLVVVVGDYTKVKDQLAGFADIRIVDVSGAPIAAPQ